MEVSDDHVDEVLRRFAVVSTSAVRLGRTTEAKRALIRSSPDNITVLDDSIVKLRDVWEATSFELEKLQSNPATVEQEQTGLASRSGPKYHLTYTPQPTSPELLSAGAKKHKVAIIREEGSNGDREMAAAFHLAGFEVWDVAMKDLIHQRISLKEFRFVVYSIWFFISSGLDTDS
jgi:phosphoribosylformylglycinamidine synthase